MESIKDALARYPQPTSTTPSTGTHPLLDDDNSRDALLERLRSNLNVTSLGHTFENFIPRRGTEDALVAFRAVADGSAPPLLLCRGTTGSGKSYLMEALAIEIYRKGAFVRLLTGYNILGVLKSCMEPGHIPPYQEQLHRYCEEPRLLIDDLGAGSKGSDWEWTVWEAIFDYRWSNRLLTVVTTNLEFDQFPVRIASRFSDGERSRRVLDAATDYRRERKAK